MCEESSEEGTMDLSNRTTFVQEELEALFKYIPSTKLLIFRQVSKDLDEAAKIVLRKRRDIKLILTTDNFDSTQNWKFLQFLNESPENVVFVAPVIHIKNTNKPQPELEEGKICVTFEIIREICKRLGNRGIIQKLIIEDGKNAPHFTSDFILTLLSPLLSLEALDILELDLSPVTTLAISEQKKPKFQLPSLKQINFRYACDEKEARKLLKIILEFSPNLEHITAKNWYYMDIISMLRDTGRLSKIKELVLMKPEDLDTLFQCKPKIVLHSFTIKTSAGSEEILDCRKLFTFLQQQAMNLKMLKFGDSLVPESIFRLPLLPVLEQLTFKPWYNECLLSVNYGRHTPALKTLKITSMEGFDDWEDLISYEISSEWPPCHSLEELHLFIRGPTSQGLFDNWKHLFPNVKKLSINDPDDFDLDEASKCWPNLEELKLKSDTGCHKHYCDYISLNEIVFGIRVNRDYWEKTGKIDYTKEDWWMKIPAPEITRTIASFKNLQKLEVIVKGYFGGFHVGDFAVYFGLRHMKNLREIAFTDRTNYYDNEHARMDISTEAFNFLVKNLPKLEKLNIGEQNWVRGELLK